MRLALLLLIPFALPALAENTLTDRDRQMLAARKAAQEAQVERARARCVEQRGVDCNTLQGLQEWMLLDRTREEAVLDQIRVEPVQPSSGTGATTPAPTR